MSTSQKSRSRLPAAFHLIISLAVVIACGSILAQQASAALATGSLTARIYLCPESVPFDAVRQSTSPTSMLDACTPFDNESAFPHLRPASVGPQLDSVQLAAGVLRWPALKFGAYEFRDVPAQDGFGGLLITTEDGAPVAGYERASLSIASNSLHVERHFYLFSEVHADGS